MGLSVSADLVLPMLVINNFRMTARGVHSKRASSLLYRRRCHEHRDGESREDGPRKPDHYFELVSIRIRKHRRELGGEPLA